MKTLFIQIVSNLIYPSDFDTTASRGAINDLMIKYLLMSVIFLFSKILNIYKYIHVN